MNDLEVLENRFNDLISDSKHNIDKIYCRHMKWIHDVESMIDSNDYDRLIDYFEREELDWFFNDSIINTVPITFYNELKEKPKNDKIITRYYQKDDIIQYDTILEKKYQITSKSENDIVPDNSKVSILSINELLDTELSQPLLKEKKPIITKYSSKKEIKNVFLNYLNNNQTKEANKESLISNFSSDCITDSYIEDDYLSLSLTPNSSKQIQNNKASITQLKGSGYFNVYPTPSPKINMKEIPKQSPITVEEGPEWTHEDKLIPILIKQSKIDPDKIFSNISNMECDLERIFGKRKYRSRISSSMDILKDEEIIEYKRLMGYSVDRL